VRIVCEGRKTEPNYFRAIKRELRLSNVNVDHEPSCAALVRSVAAGHAWRGRYGQRFSQIWCVLDDDARPRIGEVLAEMRREKIRIAFSNPCFELWYLLHFAEQRASLTSVEALRELKKHMTNYTKSADVFDLLAGRQDKAVKRAEALRKSHERNGRAPTDNPSTSADVLVTYLNSLVETKR
jgi:hypothetical protein